MMTISLHTSCRKSSSLGFKFYDTHFLVGLQDYSAMDNCSHSSNKIHIFTPSFLVISTVHVLQRIDEIILQNLGTLSHDCSLG